MATEEELLDDLDDMESEWSEAEEPTLDGEVPDGKYQVKVDEVKFKKSQSDNWYLSWQLRIISGEYEGRCLFHRNMMETPQNMGFMKKDLKTVGFPDPPPSPKKLIGYLDELLEAQLEVTVKTKGEFQNVYMNKRIDGGSIEVSEKDTTTKPSESKSASSKSGSKSSGNKSSKKTSAKDRF